MRKADNLPPSCAIVTKSGNLNFLEPSGPVQACNGTTLPLPFTCSCNTKLGSPETAIVHVGTNDLRTTRNLDFVMGEVYALVFTAKKKLPNCRLVLSGALRRRDVSWWRIGALNDRVDWVANALGLR